MYFEYVNGWWRWVEIGNGWQKRAKTVAHFPVFKNTLHAYVLGYEFVLV